MQPFTDLVQISATPDKWYPMMYAALQEVQTSFFERLCASQAPYPDIGMWQNTAQNWWNKPLSSISIDIPSGTNIQSIYNYTEAGYYWDYPGLYIMQGILTTNLIDAPTWYYYTPLTTSVSGMYFPGNDSYSDIQQLRYNGLSFFESLSARKADGTLQKWRGFRRCNADRLPTDWTDVNDPAFTTYYADTGLLIYDPDSFYSTGFIQEGDIFGPWIIDDLQIVMSSMRDQIFGSVQNVSAVDVYTMFSQDVTGGFFPFPEYDKGVWYPGGYGFRGQPSYSNQPYSVFMHIDTGNIMQLTKGKTMVFNIPAETPYKLKFYQQALRQNVFSQFYDPEGHTPGYGYAHDVYVTDWLTGSEYTHDTYFGDSLAVTIDEPMNFDYANWKGTYHSVNATIVLKTNNFTYGNINTSIEFP